MLQLQYLIKIERQKEFRNDNNPVLSNTSQSPDGCDNLPLRWYQIMNMSYLNLFNVPPTLRTLNEDKQHIFRNKVRQCNVAHLMYICIFNSGSRNRI